MNIKLNPATTRLGAVLDGIVDDEEISLGKLARAGAKIRANKARATAPKKAAAAKKKAGFLSTLWGGVTGAAKKVGRGVKATAGGLGKVAGVAMKAAGKLGLPLPVQKDIDALKSLKEKVSSFQYRARVFAPGGTIHTSLLKRKSPQLDILADRLSQLARQTTAQCTPVMDAIDAALAAGDSGLKQLSVGKLPVQAFAVFTLKSKIAKDLFRPLELRVNSMNSQYESGLSQTDKGPAVASEVARIARETVSEGGGRAAAFATSAGEIAEKVAENAGEGISKTATLLKYLPYFAVGGAALYLFTLAGGPAKLLKGGNK